MPKSSLRYEPPRAAPRSVRARFLALFFVLCLVPVSGRAESDALRIAPGDVLSVSIEGGPELGRPAVKVGPDGRIVLPRLDTIKVAGLDIDGARERIETALVARSLFRDPVVSVEVVSYRPFYVGGAVARPGAVTYEPGLTVRHALILAGGLDRGPDTDKITPVHLAELRAKQASIDFALVEVESRAARIQAELSEAKAPDFSGVAASGAASGERAMVSVDADLFKDKRSEQAAEQDHLRQVVELIDLEIDVLTKQAALQEQESAVQAEQVRNSRTLVDKGLMAVTRLQEQEREASRLSRDLLENRAFKARALQNKQSSIYELQADEIKRRTELRKEYRDVLLDRSKLEAEKAVVSAALLSAGLALAEAGSGSKTVAEIAISRGSSSIAADMNTPILPGDVIEVTLGQVPRG